MNWFQKHLERKIPQEEKVVRNDESPPEPKDRILQNLFPTVMVPVYTELSEIQSGSVRFLMAQNGLWLEGKAPWGHFRYPLWISPRPLPYGKIKPVTLLSGGPVPPELIEICREEASEKAGQGKEWAGWIVWSQRSGYQYLPLKILEESGISVRYRRPELPEGTYLLMDLHSHPFDLPTFSHTDDQDDLGGIHYSGLFSFDSDHQSKLTLRLCVEGFFIE